jgi:hypothetical protein
MRASRGGVTIAAVLLLATAAPGGALAGPFDKVAGDWEGQAEFRASVGGVEDANAHGIHDLVIRIEPGGKLFSGRGGNGCRFLGLIKPSTGIFNIQGQMSGCHAGSLNGRYGGHIYRREDGSLGFRLNMSVVGGAPLPSLEGATLSGLQMTTGKSRNATVESTMTLR